MSFSRFGRVLWSVLTITLFAQPLWLTAQEEVYEVHGVVRDAKTLETLPFANIFFSGTTYGTISDENGEFVLKAKEPGTYNLVVSFNGFKPFKKQIDLNEPGREEVTVNLLPRPKSVTGVTVTARKDRKWKRLLKTFKTIFLGTSKNASSCTILNEDILFLDYDERENIFVAHADEPLIIENPALGYKVSYVLESFKVDYGESYFDFSGYPSFEEMEGSERQKAKWIKERDRAYFGSIQHFFREVYRENSYEAGFRVRKAWDRNKDRLMDNQEFFVDSLARLSRDYVRKELIFNDFIYVKYLNEAPEKAYVATLPNTAPAHIRYGKSQTSWFVMSPSEGKVVFEKSGYWVNAQAFILEGYWSFLKMADLLPLDFEPSKQPE